MVFKCQRCGYEGKMKVDLKKHLMRKFECKSTGECVKTSKELLEELYPPKQDEIPHPKQDEIPHPKEIEILYQYDCGELTKNKYSFKTHVMECAICRKTIEAEVLKATVMKFSDDDMMELKKFLNLEVDITGMVQEILKTYLK